MSRNIISASCLMAEGYKFIIEDNGCSIFLNEISYYVSSGKVDDGIVRYVGSCQECII